MHDDDLWYITSLLFLFNFWWLLCTYSYIIIPFFPFQFAAETKPKKCILKTKLNKYTRKSTDQAAAYGLAIAMNLFCFWNQT